MTPNQLDADLDRLRDAHARIPAPDADRTTAARRRVMATVPGPAGRRWTIQRLRSRRWGIAGAAVATTLLVVALGLVVGGGARPGSTAPTTLQASFAVFRRTTTTAPAPSGVPNRRVEQILSILSRGYEGKLGIRLDRGSARQLAVPHALVVVLPARDRDGTALVCAVFSSRYSGSGSGAGCGDEEKVRRDGYFSYTNVYDPIARKAGISTRSNTVEGLLPDGATDVRVVFGNRRSVRARVYENAISTTVPGGPDAVTFVDRDGRHRRFDF